MPIYNILSPSIYLESYTEQGWSGLCDWLQPDITYEAFLTGVTETYNNAGARDRLFSDYVTQLYKDNFIVDTFVSGGTLNSATGIATFTNTTGGTLDVSGFDGFTSYWSANTNGSITNSGNTDITTTGNITVANVNISGTTSYIGAISGTGSVTAIGGFVGDVTGEASTVATIAGLAPNTAPTGTFLLPATAAAQGNITSVGTLTSLTVDNIVLNANTIITETGHLTINAVTGRNVIIFGVTFSASGEAIGVGVITNVESITSEAFVGPLIGNVTGNASGTALSVTQAAQTAITSVGTLTGLAVAGGIDLDATLLDIDASTGVAIDGPLIAISASTTCSINNANTTNGITIGTTTASVPISIGHTTSETTVNDNLTVIGNTFVSGNTYSDNYESLCSGSFKVSSLADGTYGMPGNQGTSNTNWAWEYTDGAAGLGNTSQHIGHVVPYDCVLVGVVGKMRATATGNFSFSLWTADLVDGGNSGAQTWTQSIITVPVNQSSGSKVYRFATTTGTTYLEQGDSIVPAALNGSGTESDVYGSYTIMIKRAQ